MPERPQNFEDYIGQKALKRQLRVAIESAVSRLTRLDHVLLIGTPGCGKTTLAEIIAHELGDNLMSFIMPIDPKIFTALMRDYQGVVFLDEIHRTPPKQQEILLTVLEDHYLQTRMGERIFNDDITFVGATTEGDKVIDTIRQRFDIIPTFDDYTDAEMALIVKRMAQIHDVTMTPKDARILGEACLGVPRNAEMFVKAARDLQVSKGSTPLAQHVLDHTRTMRTGLTIEHKRYCEMLAHAGGQAGIDLLSSLLGMPRGAIEKLEIPLIKQRLIERHSSGRELTGTGWRLADVNRFASTGGRRQRD